MNTFERMVVMIFGGIALICSPLVAHYDDEDNVVFSPPALSAVANADLVYFNGISPLSNPAGMVLSKRYELSYSQASYYENAFSVNMLSFRMALDSTRFCGLAAGYRLIPGIADNRLLQTNDGESPVYDESRIRWTSESKAYVQVNYAHLFEVPWARLAVGASVNASRQRLLEYAGYGIGLNAGVLGIVPAANLSIGVVVTNLTTRYIRWSPSYAVYVPPSLRIGIGWDKTFTYLYGRLRLIYRTVDLLGNEGINTARRNDISADSLYTPQQTGAADPVDFVLAGALGGEYLILDRVALRLGVQRGRMLSFGAGVLLLDDRRAAIDFACQTSDELPPTYQFALRYSW